MTSTHHPAENRAGIVGPKHVLIIIIQGLGDLVLATPALRAIRVRFPSSILTLAAPSACIDILAHESYIDEFCPLPLDTSRGLIFAWRKMRDVIRRISARQFDLLIDLTTPLHVGTLAKCRALQRLCAPQRVIAPRLADCLLWSFRRERIAYHNTVHEAQRKLDYLREIAPNLRPDPPLLSVDSLIGAKTLAQLRPQGGYLVGLAPGAARQSRQWPLERFIETTRLLSIDPLIRVVVFGSFQDRHLADRIVNEAGVHVTDLTGRLAVRDLPSVITSLNVMIANDSGLMHVSAAVKTPLVAILGAEDPRRYAPLSEPTHLKAFYRAAPCSPCRRTACSHRSCTGWITPQDVAHAALTLLRKSPGRHGQAAKTQSETLDCHGLSIRLTRS